jgi:hypothetical protein
MARVREHLRVWAIAWLVFQAASLSALVPRDCCLAHKPEPVAKHGTNCHETAAAAPMHRGDPQDADKSGKRCTLRGTCDGPMAALFALLSNHGVLPDSIAVSPDLLSNARPTPIRESLVSRLPVPDPPPPRA